MCNGFGHTLRACPTNNRITALGTFNATASSLIKQTRDLMVMKTSMLKNPDAPRAYGLKSPSGAGIAPSAYSLGRSAQKNHYKKQLALDRETKSSA